MKKKTAKPTSPKGKSGLNREDGISKESEVSENKNSQKDDDKNFPGYPHYPATEDIFNTANEKLPLVEEEVTQPVKNNPQFPDNNALNEEPAEKSLPEEEGELKPTEADVTPEEILFLDSDNLNADGGEDEVLRQRVYPVDMSGDDLDVPGSELDDSDEAIGEEDEENNSYSIGGDRHEDLEEDPV